MNILGGIANNILGIAGDWFEGRRRIAEARVESEVAIQQARVNADIDWDTIQAQNAASSWQDDGWTFVFMAIVIGCFIPGLQEYIFAGFDNLTQLPPFFQAFVGLSVGAAYGYRQIVQPFMDRLRR